VSCSRQPVLSGEAVLIVPLNAVPSQTLHIVLSGQNCTLNIYQSFWGLFCDVFVNNSPIIQGVLCLNANYIVRSIYLGFTGDLAFYDTQGTSDPTYTGLGSRFQLFHLVPADLPTTYGQSPPVYGVST